MPVNKQTKLAQSLSAQKSLGMGILLAVWCVFALPLFSGSNHSCPVLRQRDLERGGPSAQAVPAFARKYNVDCTYCHTAWPQLNRTGYIFRRLGYRMPYEVPTSDSASTKGPGKTSPSNPLPPSTISGLKQGVNAAGKTAATPEKIADGEKLFTKMQCFTCHANGENLINPAKPIKGEGFLKKYPEDAQIAQIVRRGLPGTAMPAYGTEKLSDDQLSALIAYVRSLTPSEL